MNKRKNRDLHHATIKKLYRSLYLIVFVNICSCLIFFVVAILLLGFSIESGINEEIWFILSYSTIIYCFGSASNAPILFINSTDYREAYLKEFDLIKSFFKRIFNNSVTPTNVNAVANIQN
uniref:Uncharacterized protein n=1 Tax=Meloidogyne enterolobii TaxID=390850 RepID=A0A6V7WQ79_MELEN|nr:unnamed protein product [Meloidogyne enterolobii]